MRKHLVLLSALLLPASMEDWRMSLIYMEKSEITGQVRALLNLFTDRHQVSFLTVMNI